MDKKTKQLITHVITHLVLVGITVAVLMPVFWIVNASLQEVGNMFSGQEVNFSKMSLANYINLLSGSDFLLWIKNSFIVCGTSTILCLMCTCVAGYAFSRFRFVGKKQGLIMMIIIQMFPATMAMVALYKLLSVFDIATAGFIGYNLAGLILIYTGSNIPFNMWLIKGYIDGSVPKELEESAYIDGATRWQTFVKIVLPIMGPIMAVIAIFTFIGSYNDFLIPSIVLQDSSQYTLAVGLRGFISGKFSMNWTQFAAASVLGSLPILVVFLSLQKFLVEGLTKGAVKG